MAPYALAQTRRVATHVVHHDGDDDPPNILHTGKALLVPQHFRATRMPIHAFVLGRHPDLRPGVIHPPAFPVTTADQMLQFGARQAVVNHDQSSLAFHRRLGAAIGQWEQVPHGDDPASAPVPLDRRRKVGRRTPSRVQCGIKGGQRPWASYLPGYLDGRPSRRCCMVTGDHM